MAANPAWELRGEEGLGSCTGWHHPSSGSLGRNASATSPDGRPWRVWSYPPAHLLILLPLRIRAVLGPPGRRPGEEVTAGSWVLCPLVPVGAERRDFLQSRLARGCLPSAGPGPRLLAHKGLRSAGSWRQRGRVPSPACSQEGQASPAAAAGGGRERRAQLPGTRSLPMKAG